MQIMTPVNSSKPPRLTVSIFVVKFGSRRALEKYCVQRLDRKSGKRAPSQFELETGVRRADFEFGFHSKMSRLQEPEYAACFNDPACASAVWSALRELRLGPFDAAILVIEQEYPSPPGSQHGQVWFVGTFRYTPADPNSEEALYEEW
jgi:hypothetical protein